MEAQQPRMSNECRSSNPGWMCLSQTMAVRRRRARGEDVYESARPVLSSGRANTFLCKRMKRGAFQPRPSDRRT
jgi:hypothetical protein